MEKIQNLRNQPGKWGRKNYYWEPSPSMRAAGWKGVPLGHDRVKAIAAAIERNAALEKWKAHGGGPAGVQARPPVYTLAWLIERYRREIINGKNEHGEPCLAPATVEKYKPNLARLNAWAGDKQLPWITPGKVTELKKALMTPDAKAKVHHHAAFATLAMGRTLFDFAISADIVEGRNPFARFKLAAPKPRQVHWSTAAREALPRAAMALGHTSVAIAIELGFAIGQRPQDLRALLISQYQAIEAWEVDPELYARFARSAPDGVPRGLLVRQIKTKNLIKLPLLGELRLAVEANIRKARAIGCTTILLDDTRLGKDSDPTYCDEAGRSRFHKDFTAARRLAIETATAQGETRLAAELEKLTFRDLRRTCVIHLAERGFNAEQISAITGHKLKSAQAILETYLPQTTGRAAQVFALLAEREARDAERQAEKGNQA